MELRVAITTDGEGLAERASDIARRYRLPLGPTPKGDAPFQLVLTQERLELVTPDSAAEPLYIDFGARELRRRSPGTGTREALVRAIGGRAFRPALIADATAGLGQDAFVLASWGFEVHLIERVAPVAALLEDGIRRALATGSLRAAASRMTLHLGDAREQLYRLPHRPDVVYLDPMYPERGKRALKSRAIRGLRTLLGGDPDASSLLEVALATATRRVVVKRPLRAPALGGQNPSGAISGRTIRFDLYAPQRAGSA